MPSSLSLIFAANVFKAIKFHRSSAKTINYKLWKSIPTLIITWVLNQFTQNRSLTAMLSHWIWVKTNLVTLSFAYISCQI